MVDKLENALQRARNESGGGHGGRDDGGDRSLRRRNDHRRDIATMDEGPLLSAEFLEERRIIHPGMRQREVANRFRELRTRLFELQAGRNFSLLVASVVPSGGGTFTAINLAAAIALDEARTSLVIDTNLGEPRLQELLDLRPEQGLVDYLEDDELDVGQILHPSGIPRLRVIPMGRRREGAAELFTSARMQRFLEDVKGRYPDRYVILDAPALSESADSRILADLCDYVLLVVPYGRVTQPQVERAVTSIGEERLAGVVLNDEPSWD
ncbi:polysaccharide biosynthesis protein [Thiohalospira sp.]|uniref:polysaccharide biosynthesis protein n=1 Tax=Thiohalospira sp. TaxID=3080549 RepID=UPI003980B193